MLKHLLASCGLAICVTLLACANEPSSIVCASGIVCPAPLQCAAVQAVCISNNCGNGIVDPGEVCDDGNIMDGDGCSHDCLSKEACGNGIVDPGEACDDGNTFNGTCPNGGTCNSNADCGGDKCAADKCSHDCKSLQVCGNDIVDFDEVCDDGGTSDGKCPDGAPCNANADCGGAKCSPDGCSKDCESNETCGNGIVDLGEVCDNGSANAIGSACEPGCQTGNGCGNGIVDPGEQCDDGNMINTDDCVSCKFARCGDGFVDSTGSDFSEQCDPGSAGETSTCNSNCTTPTCGDGIVNPDFEPDGVHGEQCDNGPGNNANNLACTAMCQINVCGDGFQGPGEDCDLGSANGTSSVVGSCDIQCHKVGCGNGIVDPGEQCDPQTVFTNPANPIDTASCDSDCTAVFCGDGHKNAAAGEVCDQGSANGTACAYGAEPGVCDRCSLDCKTDNPSQAVPYCGDGIQNGPEQCDTGAGNGTTSCPYNTSCQVCSATCTLVAGVEPKCGDGIVETEDNEQCDGIHLNGATCATVITGSTGTGLACTPSCRFDTSKCVTCGDGVIEAGEQCDGAALGGATCETLGYGSGTLSCNTGATGCTFNVSACTAKCGNGIIEGDEQCDENAFPAGETCASLGYGVGTLACSATCKLILTGCPAFHKCGDGKIQAPEQCDTTNFNGLTCANLGYDGDANSALQCNSCMLDVECNNCKDGFQDTGETDIDCGGPCVVGCAAGKGCKLNTDCASGFCDEISFTCATQCTDERQDGTGVDAESDKDCGGQLCPGCASGKGCGSDGDCASGLHCDSNVCGP